MKAGPSRSGLPARPILAVLAVVVLLALVVVVLRALGGGSTEEPQSVTIPLGGRQTAVVTIDSGADNVTVSNADLGGNLAVVTTPGGGSAGVAPQAQMSGDNLVVTTKSTGEAAEGSTSTIDVKLAQGVRWDVVVAKGARQIRLALGQGKVQSVELNGGADNADVTLPAPDGVLTARIPTGLASAAFHVGAGVPVKASFTNGAGQVEVDGKSKVGLEAGDVAFGGGRKAYDAAEDKVLIEVAAGVGAISVDRT